jgi:tetratricopeptide (TPR) repeat protein
MTERIDGPRSSGAALTLCNMAATLRLMGRFDEALVASERAVAIDAETLPPGHCNGMTCNLILGTVLASLGRHAEALVVLEPVLERFPETECQVEALGELEVEIANALWVLDAVKHRARVLTLLEAADGHVSMVGPRERLQRLRAAVG